MSRDNVLRISVSVSDSRVYLMMTFKVQSVGSEGALNRSVHSCFALGIIFPMVSVASVTVSESRCHEKSPCATN
jgi:hypothetical protein